MDYLELPSHFRSPDLTRRIDFLDFLLHMYASDVKRSQHFSSWWIDVMRIYKQEFGERHDLETIEQAVDALAELYLQTKREDLRFVMKIKAEQDLGV